MNVQFGDNGRDVITVQALLKNRGYSAVVPDGDFGSITRDAVLDFQRKHLLLEDGIVTDELVDLLMGRYPGLDIFGVDVSHWQPKIDWVKVKKSGISFAYMKVSEGVNLIARDAKKQATGAKAVGLPIGYYHFASLNDPNVVADADREAKFFSSLMKDLPKADLMPVLDLEVNKSNLSPALVQRWISEFLVEMASQGHDKVMLYSYTPFLDENLPNNHIFGNIPLWIAQYRNVEYPKMPKGWTSYTMWQYTQSGEVAGIGKCDVNKCKKIPYL